MKDNGEGSAMSVMKDDKGNIVHNPTAVAMRDRLIRQVRSLQLPESPIDMLLRAFGPDKVAEVTGRTQRLVRRPDSEGIHRMVVETRSPAKCLREIEEFNNNARDHLIFSEAGGVGASYHADSQIVNQRRRIHYLVQAGWRADVAIQGFGRTHRSRQVVAPKYKLCCTDLKGHKRFICSIARRLDQLGALTRGQRQAAGTELFNESDNLESEYARKAVYNLYRDIFYGRVNGLSTEDFERQTGLKITDSEGQLKESLPGITRFLNRLLSMECDKQDFCFEAFQQKHLQTIEEAKADGSYDVGVETLRCDSAICKSETVVHTDEATGAETKHLEIDISLPNRIRTFEMINGPTVKFAKNIQSGKVWAIQPAMAQQDVKTGRMVDRYRQSGPLYDHYVNRDDVDDNPNWRWIKQSTAKLAWDNEVSETPTHKHQTIHLLIGPVIPIWDKLHGELKAKRLKLGDGRIILGVEILEENLHKTLGNLNAQYSHEWTAESVADKMDKSGSEFVLVGDGNWRLRCVRLDGEARGELIGPAYFHDAKLRQWGLIFEYVNFKDRYFLPTDRKAMVDCLRNILRARPVDEFRRTQ